MALDCQHWQGSAVFYTVGPCWVRESSSGVSVCVCVVVVNKSHILEENSGINWLSALCRVDIMDNMIVVVVI